MADSPPLPPVASFVPGDESSTPELPPVRGAKPPTLIEPPQIEIPPQE
jgi:hypothetical protein